MPRTYNILNTVTGPSDASIDETGACLRCGSTDRPVLCVMAEDGETCLCQPCITLAFEEAAGYFEAFPERRVGA
jgi:hypothetical protein